MTVVTIVAAAILLILVGRWLAGNRPRRAPVEAPAAAATPIEGEIRPEERKQLENILEGKKAP